MADRITVVAAVIRKNGKLLLTSRPADKPPFGLEFPGGKVDKGENFSTALVRELREELDINAIVLDPIYKMVKPNMDLWFIRAVIPEGETIRCCEGQQYFWVDPLDKKALDELFARIPLLPGDWKFWNFLYGE